MFKIIKIKNTLALLSLTVLLLSITSDIQKKIIRDGEFDIICYVSLKEIKKFSNDKKYFWFKNSQVHNSVSKVGGLALHDEFNKFYRTKQLAESGTFNYGLKEGQWKSWHVNGNIKTKIDWTDGYKNGKYLEYNKDGALIISGTYKNNEKRNTWINHKEKDTTYFKGDSIYTSKPKSKLNVFFNKIVKRKDSITRATRKKEKTLKKINDSIHRVKRKEDKKQKKYNDSIKKARKIKTKH